MEEVPWRNLEAGKEYYIESILPTRVGDYGTPMGRKRKVFLWKYYMIGGHHLQCLEI